MRDIIFRGKRKYSGEWVQGGILDIKPDGLDGNTCCICINTMVCFVEPESVGEYIGLKDKNGRKIFEGDIIARQWDWSDGVIRYVVEYDPESCQFIGQGIDVLTFTTFDGDGECFEVVGMAYDNKEMLKREG